METPLSDEDWQQIVISYNSGESLARLMARYHTSGNRLKIGLREQGCEIIAHGKYKRKPRWTEVQVQDILRRYFLPETQSSIAKSYGVSEGTIGLLIRSAKHATEHIKRKDPKRLDKRNHQGYWVITLEKNHWLYASANATGHIFEHRLVMAEYLKRPLSLQEHVHHINGDKKDNRIENLQIRKIGHGQGVVMICNDCGSHNIVPVKLGAKELL